MLKYFESFDKILLVIHIISGFTALAMGLVAIVSKKGKKWHKTTGRVFFWSMISVSVSAVLISLLKNGWFLLHIGIFAFYMNYNGLRAIKNKKLKPNIFDWLVLILASINVFFMIYSMQLILIVFGILNAFLIFLDVKIIRLVLKKEKIPKLTWLRRHIALMMGTYISTLTAFLVVNVKNVNPGWLVWLLPTFIFTPLIVYWSKKFIKQK